VRSTQWPTRSSCSSASRPQDDDGSADLSHVRAVAREIRTALCRGAIVVNKSTVPVGTSSLVEGITGRPDITVVSNPEFLREGSRCPTVSTPSASSSVRRPRRRPAGGRALRPHRCAAHRHDTTTAETIKYASNAFLATKLSFINAIAALCEAVGADVRDLVLGLGYDKRIGFEYLRPGPGWEGRASPRHLRAGPHRETAGYDFSLLRGAIAQNDEQLERVVAKITEAAGGSLDGVPIGVWGLTFKANTDDGGRHRPPTSPVASSAPALKCAPMTDGRGGGVHAGPQRCDHGGGPL